MKHLLLTTIAAVLLVGSGPAAPDISIHDPARDGYIEAVKQHIAAGTDLNAKDNFGKATLHFAAVGGHREVAELLIAAGADMNAKADDSLTPLDWAISQKHLEIADLLCKHGGISEPTRP